MPTPAREIPENGLYLIARRVSQRELLMRPEAIVNELLTYFLGYYAGLHRIAIHSFMFLPNHFHLVVSDQSANLPAFMRDFDSVSARA